MKLEVEIDPNWIGNITIVFPFGKPVYILKCNNWQFPITRAQMLNIIDDVGRAKKNA